MFTVIYLASYLSKFRLPQVDLRSMKNWPVRRIVEFADQVHPSLGEDVPDLGPADWARVS
jgi:hypothetical protein